MKRFIIFSLCQLIIFITPFSQLLAQDLPAAPPAPVEKTFADGVKDGKQCAHEYYRSGKWFSMGCAGALLLWGPVGAGVIAGVSQIGAPTLPSLPRLEIQKEPQAYQDGFRQGYVQRAKAKALGRSLLGGAVGTVFLAGVVIASLASSLSSGSGGGLWN
jgi:hypothetical protein